MLKIENLTVQIQEKIVLKNINLHIPVGETHILFGPNGSGKSSLLLTVLGYPQYKIKKGKIFLKGKDITKLPVDERSQLGMGMLFQTPPMIKGLRLDMLLKRINPENYETHKRYVDRLDAEGLLPRDINVGFSGGERKRSELLQLVIQQPDFVMFDEPESGVDVENMKIIGKVTRELVQGDKIRDRHKSALIITHTGYILDYLSADRGYIMLDGELRCKGNPQEMFHNIQKNGFKICAKCYS
ncbi:MAG: ABC transporter ATP-binding protein [Candidatus Margulisbacteria bacterium]|nr:ABC transporter ATP-binding protein [Candidatus Margulisiibacteriota bacterium]